VGPAVATLCTVFEIQWPDALVGMFGTMEVASSPSDHIISLDCLLAPDTSDGLPVSLRKSIATLLLPAVLLAGALAVWSIVYCTRVKLRRRRHPLTASDIDRDGSGFVTFDELKLSLELAKFKLTDIEIGYGRVFSTLARLPCGGLTPWCVVRSLRSHVMRAGGADAANGHIAVSEQIGDDVCVALGNVCSRALCDVLYGAIGVCWVSGTALLVPSYGRSWPSPSSSCCSWSTQPSPRQCCSCLRA